MNKILDLVGKKIKFLILISVPIGLVCGLIEIIFAISINDVLIKYDIIDGLKKIQLIDPVKALIIIGLVRFIFFFFSQIISNLIFELLNQKIRDYVIKYNYNYFKSLGLIKSQLLLNNVTNKIAEYLNSASQLLILSSIFFIIFFHLMKNSYELTIISSLFFLILFSPIFFLKKKIKDYSENFKNNVNSVLSKIFKDIRNINFLKIVGSIQNEKKYIDNLNDNTLKPYVKYNISLGLINQLPNLLGILVFVIIIHLNSNFQFIENNLITYLYLILRAIIIFGHIMYNVGRITFSIPYVNMLFENISEFKNNEYNENKSIKTKVEINNFNLSVKNLDIGYDKSIQKNLNFVIESGEFCLISGKSGIGKTVLLSTLAGVLKPISGSIEWGGANINDINLDQFRKKISYCTTEPYLIEGTIRDNILYGLHKEINNNEIQNILEICQCNFINDEAIYSLKYQIKDDGSGLSSGQKQRLSLARAILNKPKVLILDEATVNIDEILEEKIIKNIKKLLPDTIILAVSHRKSLEKYADRIIKLN